MPPPNNGSHQANRTPNARDERATARRDRQPTADASSNTRTAADTDDNQFQDAHDAPSPGPAQTNTSNTSTHLTSATPTTSDTLVSSTDGYLDEHYNFFVTNTDNEDAQFKTLCGQVAQLEKCKNDNDLYTFLEKIDVLLRSYGEFKWLLKLPLARLDQRRTQMSRQFAGLMHNKVDGAKDKLFIDQHFAFEFYQELLQSKPRLEHANPSSPVPFFLPPRGRDESMNTYLSQVQRWQRRYISHGSNRSTIDIIGCMIWNSLYPHYVDKLDSVISQWTAAFPTFRTEAEVIKWFGNQQQLAPSKTSLVVSNTSQKKPGNRGKPNQRPQQTNSYNDGNQGNNTNQRQTSSTTKGGNPSYSKGGTKSTKPNGKTTNYKGSST